MKRQTVYFCVNWLKSSYLLWMKKERWSREERRTILKETRKPHKERMPLRVTFLRWNKNIFWVCVCKQSKNYIYPKIDTSSQKVRFVYFSWKGKAIWIASGRKQKDMKLVTQLLSLFAAVERRLDFDISMRSFGTRYLVHYLHMCAKKRVSRLARLLVRAKFMLSCLSLYFASSLLLSIL